MESKYEYYNIGTGVGYSVLDVVKSFENVNKLKLNYIYHQFYKMILYGHNLYLLIYYKYRPLRMANRCYNIQPIELVAIEKRED